MSDWRQATKTLGLILGGMVLGSFASHSVWAQNSVTEPHPLPPFVVIGETITIRFRGFGGDDCKVAAIRGYFVKCDGNEDNWYNTMATERILRGAGKK
jgi:hypothetical protein